MEYKDLLKLLATKKLTHKFSDQEFGENQAQESDSNPGPDIDDGDDEDDIMVAQNERIPASKDQVPVSGKDVQNIESLGIIDKVNMKVQGLDPWNPEDIKKYKMSQGS